MRDKSRPYIHLARKYVMRYILLPTAKTIIIKGALQIKIKLRAKLGYQDKTSHTSKEKDHVAHNLILVNTH